LNPNMPIAEVNGTTIYYKEHGRGEPILLIMGLATQMVAWPPAMIDALVAQGYRVIPFDNRDIGLSAKTQGPAPHLKDVLRGAAAPRLARADYSLADMADDAAGLLGHLGIERTHVVGVSMGGMIAQEFAIRHPERVATLASIMSNTGNKRHGRPAPSFMNEFVRSFLAPRPRTREEAVTAGLAAWRAICGPHFDEGGCGR